MKKTNDEAVAGATTIAKLFDWPQLVISLFLGAAAGGLGSLAYIFSTSPLDKSMAMSLITAGYAGADFIEGFIRNDSGSPTINPAPGPALPGVK